MLILPFAEICHVDRNPCFTLHCHDLDNILNLILMQTCGALDSAKPIM